MHTISSQKNRRKMIMARTKANSDTGDSLLGLGIFFMTFVFIKGCNAYIGSKTFIAEQTIRQNLKDPDSAKFNSTSVVWEKDNLSLVETDVSARNGFGGVTRATYCVCVNKKAESGRLISEGNCGVGRGLATASAATLMCGSYEFN